MKVYASTFSSYVEDKDRHIRLCTDGDAHLNVYRGLQLTSAENDVMGFPIGWSALEPSETPSCRRYTGLGAAERNRRISEGLKLAWARRKAEASNQRRSDGK